jgi:uracil-DNA glycosylase
MSAAELAHLQAEIRACRLCVEAGHLSAAAPIFRGNTTARIMVVGQAPGPSAAERPWPYSGASGKTLRSWLVQAGFPEEALHDPDRFYLTSLTKCFPGKARSGAGDRLPSRAEVSLCAGHLARELELVQPELILSLGRLSMNTLAPSLKKLPLEEIIGRPFQAEYGAAAGTLVLPLPHPSGVSRWLNLPENRARLVQALEWLSGERACRGW